MGSASGACPGFCLWLGPRLWTTPLRDSSCCCWSLSRGHRDLPSVICALREMHVLVLCVFCPCFWISLTDANPLQNAESSLPLLPISRATWQILAWPLVVQEAVASLLYDPVFSQDPCQSFSACSPLLHSTEPPPSQERVYPRQLSGAPPKEQKANPLTSPKALSKMEWTRS